MAVIVFGGPKVTETGFGSYSVAILVKRRAQIATVNSGYGFFKRTNVIQCIAALCGKIWIVKLDRAALW